MNLNVHYNRFYMADTAYLYNGYHLWNGSTWSEPTLMIYNKKTLDAYPAPQTWCILCDPEARIWL